MELGKYETALQAFEKVLLKKPGSREAWYRKGHTLLNLERFEDAVKAFDEVIVMNTTKDSAYEDAGALKGFAEMQLGNFLPALETFEGVLDKNPDSGITWYYRGLTLQNLQRQEEAARAFESASIFVRDSMVSSLLLVFNGN